MRLEPRMDLEIADLPIAEVDHYIPIMTLNDLIEMLAAHEIDEAPCDRARAASRHESRLPRRES